MRSVLLIVGVAVIVVGSLLYLLPTFALIATGDFRSREIFSQRSSDGLVHLVITTRAAFPANEFVDPSLVVRASLRDAGTRKLISYERVTLSESSDLSRPTVNWSSNHVRVTGFDRREKRTLTLRWVP